ncbi:hypothetical protein ACFLZB_00845 [Nanoarchaeota archaeon]
MKKSFQSMVIDVDVFSFAAKSKGLDIRNKLKLVLFAAGIKPNTFVVLRINPDSLEEEYELKEILKKEGFIFHASRAKSYEEIKTIEGDKVVWEIAGAWVGFDLFKDEKSEQEFKRYVDLLTKFKHKEADRVAGKLYDYPDCCVKQLVREHEPKYLKRSYNCYEYYKKLHDLDRKFPWVFHQAHSLDCKPTAELNKNYSKTIKKVDEKLWKEYDEKNSFKAELLVGGYSDVLMKEKSIWPEKNGYEYELITRKPIKDKYWLISFVTKEKYEKGDLLEGEIVFRHDYVDVAVKKVKKTKIENLHHERYLPLLGRKF